MKTKRRFISRLLSAWADKDHFADGGSFDQIYLKK